jgi:lipoprotein-anchoring transpeptidase ErfK/SrfK
LAWRVTDPLGGVLRRSQTVEDREWTEMKGMLPLAVLAMLGFAVTAGSAAPLLAPKASPTASASLVVPVQLETREVEIFYDRYGREIVLDPYTGEVLSVREPRPAPRYEEWQEPGWRDRPYYDDPAEMARQRREERLRQLRRLPEGLPTFDEYRRLPDRERDYGQEEFYGGVEPGLAGRDRVERQPLEDSASLDTPEIVIEQDPTTSALPDPAEQPEISLPGSTEDVARFQILLDRVGASPGVIDGRIGDNVNKAISAYRQITGETLRTYDKEFIEEQLQATGGDAFTTYEITAEDVAGPYVASIPEDYGQKAQMERMGYTSVLEMLAERFHMDERYLQSLNPGINFERPGTRVTVANVAKPLTGKVARIVADKGAKQVRAYGADGRVISVYPATIGSQATPSPSGTHTVERIALDPEYTYNPKINFQQGDNDRILTIPPGPNGPVGTVWIALSKPTYGIHGTPEPSKIGKTNSNGCIRLTAGMVEKGVTVEFID